MSIVLLHRHFEKRYAKLPKKTKDAFKERKNLFLENRNNPVLGIHALHGERKEYKSMNVTGDIRAIYKEIAKEVFLFVDIGSHGELYSS
ncbi:MAG: hypothetical protein Q7S52_03760 [bacterium]|nr:hypothetical protein [bacterium]